MNLPYNQNGNLWPRGLKNVMNFFVAIILVFFTLTLIGCKKLVTVSPPTSTLATASVFNNNEAATAALVHIYAQMFNDAISYNIENETGLLSDELSDITSAAGSDKLYTNTLQASDNYVYGCWSNAYNYIYQANAVLEALKDNSSITPAVSKQLTGEAIFLRAFWHFLLMNEYGDVPIVITTNYRVNNLIVRSPKSMVLDQVITDLKTAQVLLSDNYVDATDTTVTADRIRPIKSAAMALLARAYLYKGDYPNAALQATNLINNNQFSLSNNLDSVFLMNSREAIWQLGVVSGSGINTFEGNNFIPQSTPSVVLSPQLLAAFESGDNRRIHWVGEYPDTISPIYYYPFKYKIYQSSVVAEYTMILRLAEQYLIRAEACANGAGTGLSGALADLNLIRHRAGLGDYAGPVTTNALLNAIWHERQVELFTEWGQRWFDLARTGTINSVMGSPGNVCQFKGGTWSTNWQFYPIPFNEITFDPNLTQNAGY